MNKKITTAMVIAAMSMSIMACGGTQKETSAPAETHAQTSIAIESAASTEAPETAGPNQKHLQKLDAIQSTLLSPDLMKQS